eukprot:gene13686-13808_t
MLGKMSPSEDLRTLKAKELHPDLQGDFSTATGETFLSLVHAYEVLKDPHQRQLYDLSISKQVLGVLRQAAVETAHAAGATAADAAVDPSTWRWGLGRWAAEGPQAAALSDGGQLQRSVLSALSRYRSDLEVDLHAGLLKAFLGPRLDVLPGELPPAFECDERSHPSLSHDLLHLVHGRTLLGVVRQRQALRLTGEVMTRATPRAYTVQWPKSDCQLSGSLFLVLAASPT